MDDVSAHSLGERKEHYRKIFGAYDTPIQHREELCKLADDQARDEMLQEIHTMLLLLTVNKGVV